MNAILQWLRQAYPFQGTWKAYFSNALYGGLFVALFLFFFKPFGTNTLRIQSFEFALICFYFGLVTIAASCLFGLIASFFSSFFNEQNWVVWREIVANTFLIILIGTANLFLANVIFKVPIHWEAFWAFQKHTFLIGIFPILLGAYTKQQLLLNRYQKEANLVNDKISKQRPDHTPPTELLTLNGDNQKEELQLDPFCLIYFEAADNYVNIIYQKDDSLQNVLFRSSLKKMEQQVENYSHLFRCHRTFIVNLEEVKSVSGNAQGYKLHLNNSDKIIPVSRSLNAQIDQLLA